MPVQPDVKLGYLGGVVCRGAKWCEQDDFPAHQIWADELEQLLRFLDQQGQFLKFFPRLHDQTNEHRSAALAEARTAFFLNRIGFEICDWEPIATGGNPGDLSVRIAATPPVFVEVKAPGWQGELTEQLPSASAE